MKKAPPRAKAAEAKEDGTRKAAVGIRKVAAGTRKGEKDQGARTMYMVQKRATDN